MNTDKLVELFKTEVEKLEKEAYERGKRDAQKMDKLKTVKRAAKVGERILITKPWVAQGYGLNDIGTVLRLDYPGLYVKEWDCYVSYDEYEVIIEQPVQPLSANQQRKELIEQAREFIKNSKGVGGYYEVHDPNLASTPWVCNVEFIVNEEKRTIVALLRGFNFPILYAKGIAKCHPGEVFNADIGKAIALARALEIDVPKGFLNAVQPDDFAVGQISKSPYGTVLKITKLDDVNRKAWTGNSYWNYDALKRDHTKIINDTNAQYEVR